MLRLTREEIKAEMAILNAKMRATKGNINKYQTLASDHADLGKLLQTGNYKR